MIYDKDPWNYEMGLPSTTDTPSLFGWQYNAST